MTPPFDVSSIFGGQVGKGVLRLVIYSVIFFCIVYTLDVGVPATDKLDVMHLLEEEFNVVREVRCSRR